MNYIFSGDRMRKRSKSCGVKGDRHRDDCLRPLVSELDPLLVLDEIKESKSYLIHAFVLIGYEYRNITPYEPKNWNGKMNLAQYIVECLKPTMRELVSRHLFEDKDSSHKSKRIEAFKKQRIINYYYLPPKSPDLSIMESFTG
jgi:DDE superfamily endonuclease